MENSVVFSMVYPRQWVLSPTTPGVTARGSQLPKSLYAPLKISIKMLQWILGQLKTLICSEDTETWENIIKAKTILGFKIVTKLRKLS